MLLAAPLSPVPVEFLLHMRSSSFRYPIPIGIGLCFPTHRMASSRGSLPGFIPSHVSGPGSWSQDSVIGSSAAESWNARIGRDMEVIVAQPLGR